MQCLRYDQIIPGLNLLLVQTRSRFRERMDYLFYLGLLIFFLVSAGNLNAQNMITGDGFWTNWSSTTNFSVSAGNSQFLTRNPSGTGNRYFRLKTGGTEYFPTGSDRKSVV